MDASVFSEICKKCAGCCKQFPFIELSQKEVADLEEFTGLHSDAFTNPKTKTGETRFLQFKENGDCIFLKEVKGISSCSVYEARSHLCRNYPTTACEHDVCSANRGQFA